jgi:hypothetical protein
MDVNTINRATKEGYIRYMTDNPHYFKILSGRAATRENISAFFKGMVAEGLVAAAGLPAGCNRCARDAAACRDCRILLGRKQKIA